MEFAGPFVESGGLFAVEVEAFREKANAVKAFVFDWDGVFHAGRKGPVNDFAEADSMGLNMLRFGYWLRHGEIPPVAIITGQNNPAAKRFAERERIHSVYSGIAFKKVAIAHFCLQYKLQLEDVAFAFDDILDLTISEVAGLRLQVRCSGSPLFRQFTLQEQLCEYITANDGGHFAVRELCELLLGAWGQYGEVVRYRKDFHARYQEYLFQRQSRQPEYFGWDGKAIRKQ